MKKEFISVTIISTSLILTGCVVPEQNSEQVVEQTQKQKTSVQQIKELSVWEKKVLPTEKLKVGIITDTQVHPSRKNKSIKGPTAERYLKPRYGDAIDAFVAEMKIFQPDVIVVPGDIIEGTNDEDFVGADGLKLVQEKIEVLGVPVIWVIGNHEVRSVTKEQYKEALEIDYLNKSFEFGDYKIIVVDGNFYPDDTDVVPGGERYIRGHVAQTGIDFLEDELQTDKQTIVFIHQPPLIGEDIADRSPNGLLDNGDVVQTLLNKYNAMVALGGHIEYKRHIEKNDVDYYSLPGTIKSEAFP
ncbi:MAG: metallophosphoesterase, partial [Patescibacteria group bacterium]|nr:metallophosphoesterase [Patescibacteria group bacterium]